MKKLNIGGAAVAAPAKTTKHPSVEVSERLEALIKQFIVVNPEYKKFKAQHETLSSTIGAESRILFFEHYSGVVAQSSTMLAHVNGREVRLIVKDQYSQSLADDTHLRAAIGDANVDKYFHWRTKYAVDYDLIPETQQEAFAAGVEELRVRLGVPAEAVTAKQFIEPNAGFHESRTVLLTPDQNKALDVVLPVRANPML
jgi:hypothetical protein